jgi:glycosyltransferase involved in cell wall biosynthesis
VAGRVLQEMDYSKAAYFLLANYRKVSAILKRAARYQPVYNVNGADESTHDKRALLIYLVKPFLVDPADPQLLTHQNFRQCQQIAALLGELGYIVDAIDIRDKEFVPSRPYDLIVSNRAHLGGMDAFFKATAIKIYLASVTNHVVHNANLRRRHDRLSQRRGCEVRMRRAYWEVMPYVIKSDAIIGFGNDHIMGKWRETFRGPVHGFNNYGFKETAYLHEGKDFAVAQNHFLFFTSGSQVQKGLDLLLEIFPKLPHLHLYICSDFQNEPDFCECYRKELYETPNIHAVGWVRVNSPEYDGLVKKCAYVIHPTCSDGQSGSVVQCMYSGLVPLVTKEAGIDTEDFGVTFSGDSLDEIEQVVRNVSELPADWHRTRSIRTRKVAEERYSEKAFLSRWRQILLEVLNRPLPATNPPRRRSSAWEWTWRTCLTRRDAKD